MTETSDCLYQSHKGPFVKQERHNRHGLRPGHKVSQYALPECTIKNLFIRL